MQQSRDVLLVVVHAEIRLDPVLDHRPVPYPGGEPRRLRASFDNVLELRQLSIGQPVCGPGRRARPKPLHPIHIVPGDPLFHRRQRHVELPGQLRDRLAEDVPEHRTTAPPGCQVGLRDGLLKKLLQLQELLLSALRLAYRMAIL